MLNAVTSTNADKIPALINPKYDKNKAVSVVTNIAALNAISVLYFFSDKKEIKNVEIKMSSPKGMPKVVGYFIKSIIELISVIAYISLLHLLFQTKQKLKHLQKLYQQTMQANLNKHLLYF